MVKLPLEITCRIEVPEEFDDHLQSGNPLAFEILEKELKDKLQADYLKITNAGEHNVVIE